MNKNQMEKAREWEKFLNLFLGLKDKEVLNMLFELFMTMGERQMIADRYRLVKALLTTDLSQREIADSLNLSISKITAGSKATQVLSDKCKDYLIKKLE